MRRQINIVRADIICPLLAATFGLALAFTFSCSGDSGGGGDPGLSSSGGGNIDSSSSSAAAVPSSSSGGAADLSSSSEAEIVPSSSSESVQVNLVKKCLEDIIENSPDIGAGTNFGGNIRSFWRRCTGNPTATSAEALEGFWATMSDENGKYGDCDQTSGITATASRTTLEINCNITRQSSSSSNGAGSNGGTDKGNDIANYATVQIGDQVWMAENLNYDIPGDDTDVCYDNDPANCDKYGRLYSWATAMALPYDCNIYYHCASDITEKHRGICPSGWHIPSDAEWVALMQNIDPDCSITGDFVLCANVGTKLKTTSGWNGYNEYSGNGTNDYSFSALPGGYGELDGSFEDFDGFGTAGYIGYWWSASEYDKHPRYAYNLFMLYYNEDAMLSQRIKTFLLSVRCVRD